MKSICFYNHYHNGDIFCSKAFAQDIMNHVQTDHYYSHRMTPSVLKDMNIKTIPLLSNLPQKQHIIVDNNTVFINTWVGAYFDIGLKYQNECTLRFLYEAYARVYDVVSDIFKVPIKLGPLEDYYPLCNYNRLDLSTVNEWLNENQTKKVLISNGPCHSGQCEYNGDMVEIVNTLAGVRKDVTFIVTQPIETYRKNIVATSRITKMNEFDLNEISYLSTHCDVIIGRNSGPLCFCSTKENLNDASKTFYSFGTKDTDCLTYGINTKAKQVFEKYTDLDNLKKSLIGIIENSW